jgi:hypothetical protein
MAIDFTKPIRLIKGDKAVVTILFHDNRSVYYHVNESGYRNEVSTEVFETIFENIPEEPKKIKGFIGLYINNDETDYESTALYATKEDLISIINPTKLLAIVEINATEGEGLQ